MHLDVLYDNLVASGPSLSYSQKLTCFLLRKLERPAARWVLSFSLIPFFALLLFVSLYNREAGSVSKPKSPLLC